MAAPLRVGITGSSGLIGTALTAALIDGGHVVVPIVRRAAKQGEIGWDPAAGRLDPSDVADLDAVVNLAGVGIGDHRWTDEYRALIRSSRVDSTETLVRAYHELGSDAPKALVSASAIGYYGDRGDETLTESSAAGDGFLPSVCSEWEQAASGASDVTRVAMIRTGVVLTPDGGALAKMLPLFKLGLGGRFGSGAQWWSWISLTDEVRAIVHALTNDVEGPLNLTAPTPTTNREFTDVLGDVLGRPTFLPVPAFGPKLVVGADVAQALLFDSARVLPAALADHGFEFEHPGLDAALRAELGR
ncbi:MAG: TIGR01777 family protein [Acidimicrobiaceae bacterium]|nr:TIGR01777 family protein [Acidimicrobiaceae bacterium]